MSEKINKTYINSEAGLRISSKVLRISPDEVPRLEGSEEKRCGGNSPKWVYDIETDFRESV